MPWTVRAKPTVDLARARALLDAGHASHAAVKERLLDYVAVRLSNPGVPSALLCLLGPHGVGKTSLARLVASSLGRPCAWVDCGGLRSASALHGARGERPGRIVEELRRVGVRNPVFVLDEVDRLDEAGGAAAALLEAVAPPPGAAFRDRYLDLPFDLSEALFVATAANLGSVPAMLRERMRVVELPGYAEAEKREIATRYLLPELLRLHGLTADQVEVTDEAVGAVIGGYTREAGGWPRCSTMCAPRWCGVGPRGTRRRSWSRRRFSPGCSARPGIGRRRWPAAPGGRGSPSDCAARRTGPARHRSSKRAGWPAPAR